MKNKRHYCLEEILAEVRLNIQKSNGEITKIKKAEEYIDYMDKYKKLCIEEKQEDWTNSIARLIYSPIVLNKGIKYTPHIDRIVNSTDIEIIDELESFMNASKVMKIYNETKSWDKVDMLLKKQRHSRYSFECMIEVLIEYSPIGVEFIDRYDKNIIKNNLEFGRLYEESKKLIKK